MGLSESTVKVIAIAATAAALVAAGAALYYYSKATAAGDEPPIRVKGGSIEMDLVHNAKNWEKHTPNNKKRWKISSGMRGNDKYLVYLAPKDCSKCSSGLVHVGDVVKFIHDDNNEVVFRSTGNHTTVTSGNDLESTSTNPRKLEYQPTGFIKEIWIDSNKVCEFNEPGQLESVLITEEP